MSVTAARRAVALVTLGIAALTLAAYAPTLRFDYAQDAWPAVAANPVVERGSPREIFTSDYWKDTVSPARTLYRPVTVLSFALERGVARRADPRLSHAINLLLHALTALLLYGLARRLAAGEAAAAGCALLFSVHPLLLQAVANVVGRSDILATGFALAALLCYSFAGPWPGARDRGPATERLGAWGAGACAFLCLGSKEVGLALLPLMVLLDTLFRRPVRGRYGWLERAAALGPTVAAALAWLHLRTVAIGELPGFQPLAVEDNLLVGLSGAPRVATALGLAARYAGLLCWPAGLSPDYSGGAIAPETSLAAPLPLVGLAVLALLVALVVAPFVPLGGGRTRSPVARTLAVGAALFLFPYLLVGNLLVLNAAGFAERLVYFSATGFCLLVAVALCAVPRALPVALGRVARVALAALAAVALIAGVAQVRRLSPMWRDNQALFEYADRVSPRSLRAGLALAGRLEAEGRLDEALERYERLNHSAPDYGGAWMARGVLLGRRGDLAGAELALRRAVELRPDVGEGRMNLGLLLVLRERRAEAERELRKALLYDPGLVKAAAQLAHLLFDAGRYAEAAHFYDGCVRLGRDDLRGHLAAARARAAAVPLP